MDFWHTLLLSFMDHLKTNYMQLIAAYMQLVTPSEVAMAVRMLMAIWITIFQVSFFIIFYF